MRRSKFTINSLILVVTVFSALVFFVLVFMTGMASHLKYNDYYTIEGTDYAIRYSDIKTCGLYKGDQVTGKLMTEGYFGHDWGLVLSDGKLYVNEYLTSEIGLMYCRVVKIDLETYKKETIAEDSVLMGECASGEIVYLNKILVASVFPKTNPLARLYAMTAGDISLDASSADVVFLDPATGDTVYSVRDGQAFENIDAKYLSETLEEVRG